MSNLRELGPHARPKRFRSDADPLALGLDAGPKITRSGRRTQENWVPTSDPRELSYDTGPISHGEDTYTLSMGSNVGHNNLGSGYGP